MRFEVPQFIDVEDKIFGPLTWKQFIYLVGGTGLGVLFFMFLDKLFAGGFVFKLVLAAPFIGIGAAFAFLEVNRRPFIFYIESFFKYTFGAKKYIWQQREKKKKTPIESMKDSLNYEPVPRISNSRLKEIARSLDLQEDNR